MRINYRIILSLVIAFVITAYLQDKQPPITIYMIKVPFILAAYIYYLFRHKLIFGIIATIFLTLFGDGLSESCGIAYLLTGVCAIFANRFVLRKQLPDNSVSCGLIALPMTIIILLIQYISLLIYAEVPPPLSFVIVKLILTSIFTSIITVAIAEIIYRFELIVGNKEVANEELG